MIQGIPDFTVQEAEAIFRENYGLDGVLTLGTSERDQNFFAAVPGLQRFVLKISNACEGRGTLDRQNAVLRYLEAKAPGLAIPRLVPTLRGEFLSRPKGRLNANFIRLVTCLPGKMISSIPTSAMLRRDIGTNAARLDKALAGFHFPGGSSLIWDLRQAMTVRENIGAIADPRCRKMAGAAFDRFEAEALSQFPVLRHQLIHHDLHGSNLLVEPGSPNHLSGIIDFGDMMVTPLAVEPAIAAVHQAILSGTPIDAACDVIAAYHATLSLTPKELSLLPALMLGRLAMRMTLIAKHQAEKPQDQHFRTPNEDKTWTAMNTLLSFTGQEITERTLDNYGIGTG